MAKKATSKKNTNPEADLFAKIAQETGGEILSELDSVKYFIDTGSLAVNFVLSGKFIGGGIPGGKLTEVYGPSSSGKSLLASNTLFGCQKLGGFPVILDCENATNGEFMSKTSHLDLSKTLRYTPTTLESAFLKIHNVTRKIREHKGLDVPILFVYDSISVSPCERELKETQLPENYKAADWKRLVGRKEQPGERARVCGNELRKLQAILEPFNVTVLVINQTREKIGVMYGNPETTAGGGKALPFYASCRFRTSTKKKIENKRLNTFAGVNMKVQNIKNRSFRPFVETEGVQLYFDTGINPLSGLLSCLIESERIRPFKKGEILGNGEAAKKGGFLVVPEFLPKDKDVYTFQASVTDNSVPMDLLLDCPQVIDAASREEVEAYMASFGDAIANSLSADFEEKPVAFDEEGNPLDDDMAGELDEMDEEESTDEE